MTYLKNIVVVLADLGGKLTSTDIAVLQPDQAVDRNYLFRRVPSEPFISVLSSARDDTMHLAVSEKGIASAAISLPPLAEQRRIVERIDSLTGKSARNRLSPIPRLVETYRKPSLPPLSAVILPANGEQRMTESVRIGARFRLRKLLR